MTNAAEVPEIDLGFHEGQKVLAHEIIINKTGDGLSDAMPFDPFEIEVNSEHYIVVHVQHRKTRFDNVYSKDEGHELIGVNRVDILDALGATRAQDDDVATMLSVMEQKVADEADRKRQAKKGQFRMGEGEAVVEAEGRDATIHEMPGRVSQANVDPDEITEEESIEVVEQAEAEAAGLTAEFLEPENDGEVDLDAILGEDPSDD